MKSERWEYDRRTHSDLVVWLSSIRYFHRRTPFNSLSHSLTLSSPPPNVWFGAIKCLPGKFSALSRVTTINLCSAGECVSLRKAPHSVQYYFFCFFLFVKVTCGCRGTWSKFHQISNYIQLHNMFRFRSFRLVHAGSRHTLVAYLNFGFYRRFGIVPLE